MGLAAIIPWIGKALGTAFAAKNVGTTIAAANAGAQLLTNRAQKRSNLEMYNTQRQDALADWNRQNQYNSPEAQMARFKEAGLNPHLIYGQMTTAQPIKTPEAKAPNYVAPQADPQDFNILGRQYALDAARITNENLEKTGQLIDANITKANSETNWKNVNTRFAENTFDYRSGLLKNKETMSAFDIYTQDRKYEQMGATLARTKAETANILANTKLSTARKAEVAQKITNMITANKLLGQKVITEKQENEFLQGIKGFGIVGQTAAALLRLLK